MPFYIGDKVIPPVYHHKNGSFPLPLAYLDVLGCWLYPPFQDIPRPTQFSFPIYSSYIPNVFNP